MKERIKNVLIIIIVFLGIFTGIFLIKSFCPEWLYISCFVIAFIYMVYDLSKPEKKEIHYFMYSIVKANGNTAMGVINSKSNKFSLPKEDIETNLANSRFISVAEIDKETFEILYDEIKKQVITKQPDNSNQQ